MAHACNKWLILNHWLKDHKIKLHVLQLGTVEIHWRFGWNMKSAILQSMFLYWKLFLLAVAKVILNWVNFKTVIIPCYFWLTPWFNTSLGETFLNPIACVLIVDTWIIINIIGSSCYDLLIISLCSHRLSLQNGLRRQDKYIAVSHRFILLLPYFVTIWK